MAAMGPFDRLGRFVVRRARLVVAVWAAIILLALPFAPQAPDALRAGGFIRDDLESARAKALLEQELGSPPSALVVAFHADALAAGSPEFETAAASAMRDIPTAPHVVRVVSHLLQPRQVSADGHTAYDIVLLDLPADDSPDALPILRERLGDAPGLTVELAGGPAFYGDVQHVSERDLQRSEVISLPLAALALLIVFGSLVAAGVPLVVGGSSVLVAMAAIFVVAQFTPMSIFVLNLATFWGLAWASTTRSCSRAGSARLAKQPQLEPDRVAAAVRITVATAGRAVFFSGLTVLLGLLGLVLFEFMILRSVGIAGAIVVAFAVAAALTLLPALLTIFGHRLDRLAIRQVRAQPTAEGPWARLARWVMRRPVAVLVPTLAFLLLLGSPFLHVRFNSPDASILRRTFPRGRPSIACVTPSGRASSRRSRSRSRRTARRPRRTTSPPSMRTRAASPRSTRDARRQPGRRRSAHDACPIPASVCGSEWATRSIHRDGARRYDEGRPHRLHRHHALRPEPGGRAGTRARPAGHDRPLAAPPGATILVGGGAADVADVVDGVAADFPRTAPSSS